jgi:ketosteroid isomerase-like protein
VDQGGSPLSQEERDAFVTLINVTQQAYESRDLDGYISAFADDYHSFALPFELAEDKAALRRKMEREFARYRMKKMEFAVKRLAFVGNRGYAYLTYHTTLETDDTTVADTRENLIVGVLEGGKWLIESKIVLHVGGS